MAICRKKYAMMDVKVKRYKAKFPVLSRKTNAYEKMDVIICTCISKENYVAIRNTNGSVAVVFYLYCYFSCLFSNISTGHRPHPNVIPIRNVIFARAKRRLRLYEYRHVRSWKKHSHIVKWSSTKAYMFRKLKLQLKILSEDVIRNSSFI